MGWKESSSTVSHLQQRPTDPMVQETDEPTVSRLTTVPTRPLLLLHRGLVVGNYCHDVLYRDDKIVGRGLGGAASFISNVLDSLSLSNYQYLSKVGNDFAYSVRHSPTVVPSSPTTLFHARLDTGGRRTLNRVSACDPILPSELPSSPFDCGVAAAVGGEISPETLAAMLDTCRVVLVDAQGLIRTFGAEDGAVGLVPLRETDFFPMLPRIGFLKASAEEAPFLDVDRARKSCCVIVTDGEEGCRVCWKDGEVQVSAFPAVEIDPTGAGDSFLGGFLVGLASGLTVPDAALLGNFFGALTVGQIGIPKFDHRMLQNVKKELERKATQGTGPCWRNVAVDFHKSDTHEEFRAFLSEAAKYQSCSLSELSNGQDSICQ